MENNMQPKLRFKEFSGDWKHRKFKEITKNVSKKNKENKLLPVYSINNKIGFISQKEQFEEVDSNARGYDTSLYKIIYPNTFAYNPARINVGSIGYSYDLNKIIISSLYVCFKTTDEINDELLFQYFRNSKFNKDVLRNVEGGVRDYLFYNNFANIKYNYSTLPEQEKIASFLSSVDTKIEKLEKKKVLLEQYKKGIMQKIFSQEIRFKDENKKDYPEWEEKKLGEVGSFKNGLNKSKEDFGFGIPFINLMDVFGKNNILSNTNLGLVNANPKEIKDYNIKKGDVLFIRSSVKPTGVGLTSVILNDLNNTVYSGFIIRFRDDKIKINVNYKKYCFYDSKFRNKIMSKSTTSANTNINQESLNTLKIKLPCLEEQQKIANFLSGIDQKIDLVEKEITSNKEFKKGLLQQMLV